MLKKLSKYRATGVCHMMIAYGEQSLGTLNNSVRVYYKQLRKQATTAWCDSSAVPSTTYTEYPVAHPTLPPATAYVRTIDLWAHAYGQNRLQYLEFMSDYLEEAWK